MNHVVIIGFMGSGKTRVGKQLSKDLGLPFVDLEKIITKRMNLSAREIFERSGEPYYRALETLALKQLIQDSERKVISLGAGLPLQEQNEKYLRELGTVVYLKGSLATLKKRLEGSKKDPMLDGEDRDDKIKKLLKQRDPVYQKFADIQVTTGEVPFEELIKEIEEKLASSDNYLVDVVVKPGNLIIIEIDNDEAVCIDDCVELSRYVEEHLDRDVEDFELEVGSAGVTSPFKVLRQYVKNIGNEVEMLLKSGVKLTGVLKSADENGAVVIVEKQVKPDGAKRKVTVREDQSYTFEEIKYTKYLIRFK